MGNFNQLRYVRRTIPKLPEGTILEIGSRDEEGGDAIPFRSQLACARYVGLDLISGRGVDVVGDLSEGLCGLDGQKFDLILCCSVLEHVRKPWPMAQNITRLLAPLGTLYVSVPWVWRYHPCPDDYWRFSWRGIMTLFDELEWSHKTFSTNVEGEFFPARHGMEDSEAIIKGTMAPRKYLPYLQLHMVGKFRR